MVQKPKGATSRVSGLSQGAQTPGLPGPPPLSGMQQGRMEPVAPPDMPPPSQREQSAQPPQGDDGMGDYEIPNAPRKGQVTFQDQQPPMPMPQQPNGGGGEATATDKVAGLPKWAWILIGVLGAAVVALIIGIVVGRKTAPRLAAAAPSAAV